MIPRLPRAVGGASTARPLLLIGVTMAGRGERVLRPACRATAKRFVQEGMDPVLITGRRKDALDAAVAEIGRNVTGVAWNTSLAGQLQTKASRRPSAPSMTRSQSL